MGGASGRRRICGTLVGVSLLFGCAEREARRPEPPPCSSNLIVPGGGEEWTAGSLQRIRWVRHGSCGDSVSIDLLLASEACLAIAESAPNDGLFDWTVEGCGEIEGPYRIRVTDKATSTACVSDTTFRIVPRAAAPAERVEIDSTAPAPVADLAAGSPTSNSLQLTWTAVGDDGMDGSAARYEVRYAILPITEEAWESAAQAWTGATRPGASGSRETLLVSGLREGTVYYFRVKTLDEAGNESGLSNEASASTSGPIDLEPPAAVDALAAQPTGPTGMRLTWRAVGDDGRDGTPAAYDLRFSTQPITDATWESASRVSTPPIPKSAGQTETVEIDGLQPSTTYFFRVIATDEAENWSGLSNEARATTRKRLPPVASMVRIPAGSFQMGSPSSEPGRWSDETLHVVRITGDFLIGEREVTQTEWQAVMGWNASLFQGANRPIERVTWFDAVEYCNRRSEAEGLTPVYAIVWPKYDGNHLVSASVTWNREAEGYRLPTEAEWEYACRAGSSAAFPNGEIADPACGLNESLDRVGWFCGNATGQSQDVKKKEPNGWGLYDMHGNVSEWCWDWHDAYGSGPQEDPSGSTVGSGRVSRGGSWFSYARLCRSAARQHVAPDDRYHDLGLRLARNAP